MTPQQLEKLLLLEQSGELSPEQSRRLQQELAASTAARYQRNQLQKLAAHIPPLPWQPAPGAAERIAARLSTTPPAPRQWTFRPAWAAAAAIITFLAISAALRHPNRRSPPAPVAAAVETEAWNDPLDADFAAIENLLADISAEPFEWADL